MLSVILMRKPKDNNTDMFARIASILSLVVSVIAIIAPIIVQKNDEKEKLDLKLGLLSSKGDWHIVLPNKADSNSGYRVIQLPLTMLISNTGKNSVSITMYTIYMGN